MYAKQLKEMFKGITLELEDLFLLEAFQIGSLQQYAPKRELAAVLHANSDIKRFLITKHPPIISNTPANLEIFPTEPFNLSNEIP